MKECEHCAQWPFQRQREDDDNLLLYDFDGGIYDLMIRMSGSPATEEKQVPEEAVEKVLACSKKGQQRLRQAGLWQGPSPEAPITDRIMASLRHGEVSTGKLLGSGSFSTVYEVLAFPLGSHVDVEPHVMEARDHLKFHALRSHTDEKKKCRTMALYAVKHVKRSLLEDHDKFTQAAMDLAMEAQLLLVMDHPNIIAMHGMSYGGPQAYLSGRYNSYFLILDRLTDNLEDRCWTWRNDYKAYTAKSKRPWARQKFAQKLETLWKARLQAALDVSSALAYMHQRRIINRDVKSCNAGFTVRGELKLFDFGLSRMLPSEDQRVEGGFPMSRVGTHYYMAPEIRDSKPYDLSADVFSFGVVLWEVLSLSTPRDTLKKMNLGGGDSSQLPTCPCWPADVSQLLERSLSEDASLRPTSADALETLSTHLQRRGHTPPKPHDSSFRIHMSQVTEILSRADDWSSVATPLSARKIVLPTKDEVDRRKEEGLLIRRVLDE